MCFSLIQCRMLCPNGKVLDPRFSCKCVDKAEAKALSTCDPNEPEEPTVCVFDPTAFDDDDSKDLEAPVDETEEIKKKDCNCNCQNAAIKEPVITEPVMPEPVIPEPVITEPVVPEPDMSVPDMPEPDMPEPALPKRKMPIRYGAYGGYGAFGPYADNYGR